MAAPEDTHHRILDATWKIITANGREASIPTLSQVARAAKVSRQAVYLHFGNRATLLIEVARERDRVSGFPKRIRATFRLKPLNGLEAYIRTWFAYIPEIQLMARALLAAEAAGEEGGEAWRDRMDALRSGLDTAITRLDRADLLADGWDVSRAADWTWSRIHFTTWHHLVVERGWPPGDVADTTVRSVMADIVAPGRVTSSPAEDLR